MIKKIYILILGIIMSVVFTGCISDSDYVKTVKSITFNDGETVEEVVSQKAKVGEFYILNNNNLEFDSDSAGLFYLFLLAGSKNENELEEKLKNSYDNLNIEIPKSSKLKWEIEGKTSQGKIVKASNDLVVIKIDTKQDGDYIRTSTDAIKMYNKKTGALINEQIQETAMIYYNTFKRFGSNESKNPKSTKTSEVFEGKIIEMAEIQNREGIAYEANQSKPFTGKAIDKYSNGQLAIEITYKNGQPDGVSKAWYEDGQQEAEANFKNGKMNGVSRTWYENGQLMDEANFKEDELDGLCKEYYENGQIKAEVNYKNNQLNGVVKRWYNNGQLSSEQTYKNKKIVSIKAYDAEGRLLYKKDNKSGISGLDTSYYEDGTLRHEAVLKNGIIEGVSKSYYPNGSLKQELNYKNGEEERFDISYNENGQLLFDSLWSGNKLKNDAYFSYKNELLTKVKVQDRTNNQIIFEKNDNNGINELIKLYYTNNQLRSEYDYKNGRLNGMKVYYENGDLYKEVIYEDGALVNIIEYYENGRIKFIDDGHESSYYEDEPINFKELTKNINKLEKEVTEHKKTGEIGDGHHFGWQIAGMRQYLEGLSLSKNLSSEDKNKLKKLENQLDNIHIQAQKIWDQQTN